MGEAAAVLEKPISEAKLFASLRAVTVAKPDNSRASERPARVFGPASPTIPGGLPPTRGDPSTDAAEAAMHTSFEPSDKHRVRQSGFLVMFCDQ